MADFPEEPRRSGRISQLPSSNYRQDEDSDEDSNASDQDSNAYDSNSDNDSDGSGDFQEDQEAEKRKKRRRQATPESVAIPNSGIPALAQAPAPAPLPAPPLQQSTWPFGLTQSMQAHNPTAQLPASNWNAYLSLPDLRNMAAYNQWAQQIVNSVNGNNSTPEPYSAENLPPILSFIDIRWGEPEYKRYLFENDRKVMTPNISDQDQQAQLRDIPWLPRYIPYQETGWKLAVYKSLGASYHEMAKRVHPNDRDYISHLRRGEKKNYFYNISKISRKMRKKTDDWRKKNGGLCSSVGKNFKSSYNGKKTDTVLDLLKRVKRGGSRAARDNASGADLRLFFNCIWDIDPHRGCMISPNGNMYRLFEPRPAPEGLTQLLQDVNWTLPRPEDILARYPLLPVWTWTPESTEDTENERRSKRHKSKRNSSTAGTNDMADFKPGFAQGPDTAWDSGRAQCRHCPIHCPTYIPNNPSSDRPRKVRVPHESDPWDGYNGPIFRQAVNTFDAEGGEGWENQWWAHENDAERHEWDQLMVYAQFDEILQPGEAADAGQMSMDRLFEDGDAKKPLSPPKTFDE